jgi:hypothetical protein
MTAAIDPNDRWPGKEKGEPEPAPNVEMMREHLERLFGGDRCAGMLDGLIEVAYTDSAGKLKHAQLFTLDELDEAAEFGVRINSVKGINAYLGMALRKPGTPQGRRTTKGDVLGTVAEWVDWDAKGEGDSEAVREKTAFLPPNIVVVTGKHPWTRSQGIWLLDEPIIGADAIEAVLRPMARSLRGDPAVVNADRVMRWGGTVAWAHKPGRIREQTRLVTEFTHDGDKPRAKVYQTERVLRAFQADATEPDRASAGAGADAADPHAKNPFTGRFDAQALLRSIRPGNWHTPMRDFVAHMVGRGRQDWEIRAMAAPYDEPGHQGITVQDLIDGARRKYNKPNPADPASEFDFSQQPPAPLSFISASSIVIEELDRRPWLFGGWLMKGIVSVMVGPGGAGKSMVSIHAALAYAAGREWAGQKPLEEGGAWIWNNEDDLTELKRRVGGTAKHMGIDLKTLGNRLLLGSGVKNRDSMDARRLVLARTDERGEVAETPDVQDVIRIIRENGIKLFTVDPMVSIHYVNENDNGAIAKVMDALLTIATEGDCSVLLLHHIAKPGANVQQAGNQYIWRGATSGPGAARLVITVTQMTEDDATHMMGEDYDEKMRERCIRIDTGKANMLPPGKDTTFLEKVSVSLGNGSGTRLEDDSDQIGGLSVADFSEYQQDAKVREQDFQNGLREMVATCMEAIDAGGEIDMTTLVSMILGRTEKFGKKSSLRQELLIAIPPAHQGGIRVREYVFDTRRSGTHKTATIYVCKREVG